MNGRGDRQFASIAELRELASCLELEGHDLRITCELETAIHYLRERYQDNPSAGYGLLASSRDKGLCSLGIPNG